MSFNHIIVTIIDEKLHVSNFNRGKIHTKTLNLTLTLTKNSFEVIIYSL